jgi:type IV secretory pathway VirB9-like protein
LFLGFEAGSAAATFSREIAQIDIGKSVGLCIGIPGSPACTKANRESEDAVALASGISIENLQFRYVISGDSPSWKPLRAFDDRARVYIQFPTGIGQGELPPLFVMGADGDAQLVNYRVRAPYYIVDRLFAAAELRIGGKNAPVVRITRTDVPGASGFRSGRLSKQAGPP